MAVSYLRAPTASAIGDGSIVQIAARIAVLIAIVTLVVFLRALHAPKTSKLGEETHAQRLQQPVGVQKKKGNRAKKGKKTRGTSSTKIAPELDVISEEELEVGRVQSSSDVEAPSVRDSRKQESHSEVGVDQDKSESESESGDIEIEMRTDEASPGCGHVCLETVPLDDPRDELPPISALLVSELIVPSDTSIIAFNDFEWEEVHEPIQSQPADDADVPCKECTMPDMHLWGCSAHRTYTSALLLMHREMQVVVARGPPGLERPAALATASGASLCSMRVA